MKNLNLTLRSTLIHEFMQQLGSTTSDDAAEIERHLRHVLWLTLEAGDQDSIDAALRELSLEQRPRLWRLLADTVFEREIPLGNRRLMAQAFAIPMIFTTRERPPVKDRLPAANCMTKLLAKFNAPNRSPYLSLQNDLYNHAELSRRNEAQHYRLMNEMVQKPLLGGSRRLSPVRIVSPVYDCYSIQLDDIWVSLRYLFGVSVAPGTLGFDLDQAQLQELEAELRFHCQGDPLQPVTVKVLAPQRPDRALDAAIPAFARVLLRQIHDDMPHPSHPAIFLDHLEREVRFGVMEEEGDVIAAVVRLPEGRPDFSATVIDAVADEGKALGLPPVEMVCLAYDNPIVSNDGFMPARQAS